MEASKFLSTFFRKLKSKTASQKEKLTTQQDKLKKKLQLIKLQERKQHTKKLIDLGALVMKAHLDNLDKEAILGALLEIKSRSQDAKKLTEWQKRAQDYAITQQRRDRSPCRDYV